MSSNRVSGFPVSSSHMERETGIEPATNSLEGCDSTTELLPPFRTAMSGERQGTSPKPEVLACLSLVTDHSSLLFGGQGRVRTSVGHKGRQIYSLLLLTTQPPVHVEFSRRQAGMPSVDLSARLYHFKRDRTAVQCRSFASALQLLWNLLNLPLSPAAGARPLACRHYRFHWSWRRDLNPRPSDYKSDALPD